MVKHMLKYVGIGLTIDSVQKIEVKMFLNRILGIPSLIQSSLFDSMTNIMDQLIYTAKKTRTYDQGIVVYKNSFVDADKIERVIWQNPDNKASIVKATEVRYVTLVSYDDAVSLLENSIQEFPNGFDGFYITKRMFNVHILLAIDKMSNLGLPAKYVTIYKPVKGRHEMEKKLFENNYEKLEDVAEAKKKWNSQINSEGHQGEIKFNLITGDIFSAYNVVKNAINLFNNSGREVPVQVVRVEATICRFSDRADTVESPAESSILKSLINKSFTDTIVINDSNQEGAEVDKIIHLCGIFVRNDELLQKCKEEFERITLITLAEQQQSCFSRIRQLLDIQQLNQQSIVNKIKLHEKRYYTL